MAGSARNEAAAGAKVALAVAVLLAATLAVPSLRKRGHSYDIRFPLSMGVAGIVPGTEVDIAGLPAGEVTAMYQVAGSHPGKVKAWDVRIRISREFPLHEGVLVYSSRNPVSGGAMLTIEPPEAGARIAPGSLIEASSAPAGLEAILGRRASAQVRQIGSDIAALRAEFPSPAPAEAAIERTRENVAAIRGTIEAAAPGWSTQARTVLDGAELARDRIQSISAELLSADGGIAALESRASAAKEAITAVADDGGALHSALESEAGPRGRELIRRAVDAYDRAREEARHVMAVIRDAEDAAGVASAELTMAGTQLNKTLEEVVLMPWTLLGGLVTSPDVPIDLARELAQSATDLQEAVAAARSLVEQQPGLAQTDPETLELARRWLEVATRRSQVLERLIFERMLLNPPRE